MRRTDVVMSISASSGHPLDTDLMDLVDGNLSPDAVRSVEAHLATCVLCRIKRQRLTNEAPISFVDLHDVEIPTFGRIETVDASPATALPGELWLTHGDEATMLLVRKVLGPPLGLVVVPVTFDTEVADNGTVVLDSDTSPLGVPLAIYDGMLSGLPLNALLCRVVTVREVDLLTLTVGERGVLRGSPLEGPGDPRHEVRQYIADRLTALSPTEEDDADTTESADAS